MSGLQDRSDVPSIELAAPRTAKGETLAQAAYRALRSDIISGVRKPGERLRVGSLKTIYGIGPTPLREALQMLAADQLVHSSGNRGFTVEHLDPREFEDLNIARTAVETAALRLSIQKGDMAWEAGVVAASYMMAKVDEALMASKDTVPENWEETHAAFHLALVAACGSRALLGTRSHLLDKCARYRRTSLYQKRGSRNLGEEHAAISKAVLARDTELACRLTERHFDLTAQSLANPDDEEGTQ